MTAAILFEFGPELRLIQFIDFCCTAMHTVCITHTTEIRAWHSIDGIDAAVTLKVHH